MHVKQIIIQGFKSYKDQTVIEPFSPKHNVIVGRNGSGKSNFFAAIRFVLNDSYTNMDREERQALLHEGSGSAVVTAYVEIIFDNTDGRFPTGKEELILRRTIGQKKDEYSLDRKNATKADVMNLLESAGFSRSNPYYIVPQGRVTALTNMKDTDRLRLLKEVAGTQVYEARRSESVKIMGDTDSKRSKIDESLEFIEERLAELEEEQKELRAYQEKDREKRCLQYAIFYQQLQQANTLLEDLESRREQGMDKADEERDAFVNGEKELGEIDDRISSLQRQINLFKVDKRQIDGERREATKTRAQVELQVNNLADDRSEAEGHRREQQKAKIEVEAAIAQREEALSALLPEYEQAFSQEMSIKSQLDDADSSRQRLYAKQGRSAKFKSKSERDNWLKKEIDDVNIALAKRKAVVMQKDDEIAQLHASIQQANADVLAFRGQLENRGSDTQALSTAVQQAKETRDRLTDQRKELWREDAKLDSLIRTSRAEMERSERILSHLIKGDQSRGIQAVRRIKNKYNLEGVYGTLAELFTVSDRYKTAVEVTAGDSLFHYVVDNDETATKVLDILNKEKAGRVTFMPLNRLRPRLVQMPSGSDAIEMISKLNFDSKYEKAFQQVFGKAIICPNIQIASQYARSHGVSAITPDGDRSDKKGALTGGFHDPSASKLDAVKSVNQKRAQYEEHFTRSNEVKRSLDRIEQEITKAVGETQKAEQRRSQQETAYGPLQQELRARIADVQSKQGQLESQQKAKDKVRSDTNDLEQQLSAYGNELASDFKKALSSAEEQMLQRLSSSIPILQKQYNDLSQQRQSLESKKSLLEVALRENLRPILEGLRERELESALNNEESKLKELQKDLKRARKVVENLETQLQQINDSLDSSDGELQDLILQRSSKQSEQEELAKSIERFERRLAKGMAEKVKYNQQLDEANRSIRELGALPEEAFDKYTRIASEKAVKRLETVNNALKKYSHVNKKAFEQYNNFTRQRESLQKRRGELDTSQDSIRELIEVLDQRKDEAIERTFKQVSREFATIFEKLVPAGRGRLIIQRRSDRQARAAAADPDSDAERDGVENYTGVSIAVSFNSRHDEQQYISQLSGGQKSLCALALVFAIQRCDPAPFYLFDEIDANLDAQYRTAVAELLRDISQTGQFICTTFRPEMVLVAEKCYGVAYGGNKTSTIDVVNKETALSFIEGQISAT